MRGKALLGKRLELSREAATASSSSSISERAIRYAERRKLGAAPVDHHRSLDTDLAKLRHDVDQLLRAGGNPGGRSYVSILHKCSTLGALAEGRRLHGHILSRRRLNDDVFIANLIVLMYGKCGSVGEAKEAFDAIVEPNTHSWNILLGAYAQNGHPRKALGLYLGLTDPAVKNSPVTCCTVLGVCSVLGELEHGRKIHRTAAVHPELAADLSVGPAIVNMYGKCGCPDEAKSAFDGLVDRSPVCWNALLSAFAQNDKTVDCIRLYRTMDLEGMKMTAATFASVIRCCSSSKRLAMEVHSRVVGSGLDRGVVVSSALVHMFGRCGMLDQARRTFDDMSSRNVFTWSAMIGAYVQNGQAKAALELFRRMEVKPNNVTFVNVLDACAQAGDLATGRQIHFRFTPSSLDTDLVLGNALMNMYGKCGECEEARAVFDRMPRKNVVTWTTMMSAYGQNRRWKEAVELFDKMDVEPSLVTLVTVLDACASAGALREGRKVHDKLTKSTAAIDSVLGNAVVNMYGKCGSLDEAWQVFSSMKTRNVVSWTAMLVSYAEHGHEVKAVQVQSQMDLEGIAPDDVTFISLLFALSHSGKLQAGLKVFKAMVCDYFVDPTVEHYRCVLDLLARSGRLGDAEDLVRSMPYEEDVVSWSTLLSACVLHVNEKHGKRASERLIEMDPWYGSAYVMLRNIYAENGQTEMLHSSREPGRLR